MVYRVASVEWTMKMQRETIPVLSRQLALLGSVVALPILLSAAGVFAFPLGHGATPADVRLAASLLLLCVLLVGALLASIAMSRSICLDANSLTIKHGLSRLALITLLALFMADAGATNRVDAIRRQMGPGDSAIISDGRYTIYLIGAITPALARDFKEATEHGPLIDTVIVDSQGGDMSSALDIANLIYRRKLNIVVDGRCFSACANYLFPAGHLKSLRGQSFLGIHNRTYSYLDGGVSKHATHLSELQSTLKKSSDKQTARDFAELHKKESKFFAAIKMSTSLDTLFTNYLERRELVLSKASVASANGASTCPKINLWVLRREQVASIGLKNIGEFWEPRTTEEQRLLQIYFKVPLAESFFWKHDGFGKAMHRTGRTKLFVS